MDVGLQGLLKGSWYLVTRVIIRVTILITPIKVLITLLTKFMILQVGSRTLGWFRGVLGSNRTAKGLVRRGESAADLGLLLRSQQRAWFRDVRDRVQGPRCRLQELQQE